MLLNTSISLFLNINFVYLPNNTTISISLFNNPTSSLKSVQIKIFTYMPIIKNSIII